MAIAINVTFLIACFTKSLSRILEAINIDESNMEAIVKLVTAVKLPIMNIYIENNGNNIDGSSSAFFSNL